MHLPHFLHIQAEIIIIYNLNKLKSKILIKFTGIWEFKAQVGLKHGSRRLKALIKGYFDTLGKECTTRPELVYCIAQMVQSARSQPFVGNSPTFGSAHQNVVANGESLEKAAI